MRDVFRVIQFVDSASISFQIVSKSPIALRRLAILMQRAVFESKFEVLIYDSNSGSSYSRLKKLLEFTWNIQRGVRSKKVVLLLSPEKLSLREQCELHERLDPAQSNFKIITLSQTSLVELAIIRQFHLGLAHRLTDQSFHCKTKKGHFSEEFGALVHETISFYAKKENKRVLGLSKGYAFALECFPWRNRYSALQRVIEYSVKNAQISQLRLRDLPFWLQEYSKNSPLDRGDEQGVPLW